MREAVARSMWSEGERAAAGPDGEMRTGLDVDECEESGLGVVR